MKISIVAVSSLNGKLTKGNDPNIYSWISKEDSQMFFSLIEKNNLIVMGNKTYEAARNVIKLKKNKLRIVLTRNPEKYLNQAIKGILEFTNESPLKLIKRLEDRGYKKMLVVGGSRVNTLFLKSKIVNEIYLTLEPKIFGSGKNLIIDENVDILLKLISIKKLNQQGSLHLVYTIVYV